MAWNHPQESGSASIDKDFPVIVDIKNFKSRRVNIEKQTGTKAWPVLIEITFTPTPLKYMRKCSKGIRFLLNVCKWWERGTLKSSIFLINIQELKRDKEFSYPHHSSDSLKGNTSIKKENYILHSRV